MIKIVVDSGCDLTENMRNKNNINIELVPLTMHLGEREFKDNENLDIEQYISEMESYLSTPKTAAPSPQSFLEKYKGDESIFGVTLSSKLSGSYNSAVVAQNMYNEEIGHKFIHIFDSLSASVGETLIAMKIDELHKQNMTNYEIVTYVTEFINNMSTYFILEKFDTIVKTGRMNPYVAKVASLLSFKPICGASEGSMVFLDKARGFNKAISKLISMIEEKCIEPEKRILGISHVKSPKKAQAFKDEIMKKINFKDIIVVEASGLCATYANREGLIIAF